MHYSSVLEWDKLMILCFYFLLEGMWPLVASEMASGSKTAVLARMEVLYREYNQLSQFLRAMPESSEGAPDLSLPSLLPNITYAMSKIWIWIIIGLLFQESSYFSNHYIWLLVSDVVNVTTVAADIISIESLKQQVKNLKAQVEELATGKATAEKTLQQQKNESIKRIDKLKREVADLEDDTDVLKNILKRLNEELNK